MADDVPYPRFSLKLKFLVCLIIIVFTVQIRDTGVWQVFENRFYDLRIRLAASREVPMDDIVIIGIDDKSLQVLEPALGRWPWPRRIFANILDYCSSARLVATDIIFSEKDKIQVNDQLFVEQVKYYGEVVSAIYFANYDTGADLSTENLKRFSLPESFGRQQSLPNYKTGLIPHPALLDASRSVGHVNHDLDDDGVLRSYDLAARCDGNAYPSLALAMAIRFLKVEPEQLTIDSDNILELGSRRLRVNSNGQLRILPSNKNHQTFSVLDVLRSWDAEINGEEPDIKRSAFKDKIIFIGSLATGLLADREITAGAESLEGVRITAIALDNIINRRYITVLPRSLQAFAIVVLGLFSLILSPERPRTMVAAVVMVVLGYAGLVLFALFTYQLMIPVTAPIAALLASSTFLGSAYWYREMSHRKKLEFNLKEAYENLKLSNNKLEEYSQTLAEKIRARTQELSDKNIELEENLDQIKKMQRQLVMQEKLASLGQVTAGIAHEIKNPLNFVNNFSKLSIDLSNELLEEIEQSAEITDPEKKEYINEIINDLKVNAERIDQHGRRANKIVTSMLLQYHGASGERALSNIVDLLDDSISLVYHGKKVEDSTFYIDVEKNYDLSIGEIEVVPQELGRAFLNILSNACYAVDGKKKNLGSSFKPLLTISTKDMNGNIEIRIRDNGPGIPEDVRQEIFNPFFTTKPAGKGTGLGLSICYEIIVLTHNGKLEVESEADVFTEFIITLPKGQNSKPVAN